MFALKMNVVWENLVQLGLPLFFVIVPIVVAIVLLRKPIPPSL